MKALPWWPVMLILLAAPFATWGWGWLEKQRMLAVHAREIAGLETQARKDRGGAYELGKRDALAEVRDAGRTELEATRAELARMEEELEAERARMAESPPETSGAVPVELVELCKRSASCRDRRGLK